MYLCIDGFSLSDFITHFILPQNVKCKTFIQNDKQTRYVSELVQGLGKGASALRRVKEPKIP